MNNEQTPADLGGDDITKVSSSFNGSNLKVF